MSGHLLEVNNLRTYYRTRLKEHVHAVDGVSFTLDEGRILGIAGESGCGKSTLALSMMGYYAPPLFFNSGSLCIDGEDIMELDRKQLRLRILGSRIAYIPQAAMNALNPTMRIIRFVEDLMREHRPQLSRKQVREMAAERFEDLHLPARVLKAFPNELSGGMKQRTVIAISTILNPTLLIADEPTSALDVSSQKVVIALLMDLMEKKFIRSLVFITHELPLLYQVADEIIVMYAGEIVEHGGARQIIFDPLHPYSKKLMGSIIVPERGIKGHKLAVIPGAPPNLKHVAAGCRFADRCEYVGEACRTGTVEIRKADGCAYRCLLAPETLREIYAHERE